MPELSVIIPAADEEDHLAGAIASVRAQEGVDLEVIVVVNGARDGTLPIAGRLADRVLHREARLGYSAARNLGARAARAPALVFLDADSAMGPGVARRIVRSARGRAFGTVLGRPDPQKLRYRLFFLMKNTWHRLGLYHGALGGLMFFQRELFLDIDGFDVGKEVDELFDISVRARRAGGRYVLLRECWARTSMRRFERNGLLATLGFWIRVRYPWLFPRGAPEAESYPG